jgi:hypothetical protein
VRVGIRRGVSVLGAGLGAGLMVVACGSVGSQGSDVDTQTSEQLQAGDDASPVSPTVPSTTEEPTTTTIPADVEAYLESLPREESLPAGSTSPTSMPPSSGSPGGGAAPTPPPSGGGAFVPPRPVTPEDFGPFVPPTITLDGECLHEGTRYGFSLRLVASGGQNWSHHSNAHAPGGIVGERDSMQDLGESPGVVQFQEDLGYSVPITDIRPGMGGTVNVAVSGQTYLWCSWTDYS